MEHAAIIDRCLALVQDELPVTDESTAYNSLFNAELYDFNTMELDEEFCVIFKRCSGRSVFRLPWMADAVNTQAITLRQILLCPRGT